MLRFPCLALAATLAAPALVPDMLVAQVPVTRLAAEPRIVGPGVVSTPAEEFRATIAPDGATLVYVVTDHLFRHMSLVQSTRRGEQWGTPVVVPFSGIWRDGDPAFAPDGRSLVFISNRPLPGDSAGRVRHDFNIWVVERHRDGSWGKPVALGPEINTDSSEMSPSITAGGVLYFSRGPRILRARASGGGFSRPEPLFEGGDPAIAADERFLVFDADGPTPGDADLFVTCRQANGWTTPTRLAEPVSSTFQEGDPFISADGRTLFFFSERFIPAPDRVPRPRRATYQEISREARENIYNGSRNIYQVDISSFHCPGSP